MMDYEFFLSNSILDDESKFTQILWYLHTLGPGTWRYSNSRIYFRSEQDLLIFTIMNEV